jgi:hypothetical protein
MSVQVGVARRGRMLGLGMAGMGENLFSFTKGDPAPSDFPIWQPAPTGGGSNNMPWYIPVLGASTNILTSIFGRNQTPQYPTQPQNFPPQVVAQVDQYGNPLGNAGAAVGTGIGNALTGVTNFIGQNPLLVAGIGFGAYLLFREPPRSRR